MSFYELSSSLPNVLINKIFSYVPTYNLYLLSKPNFDLYIGEYYNYHKNKSDKRSRFYYGKVNNTYIRFLIRNNMYLFLEYLLYSNISIPLGKIKRYYYKEKVFKKYIDYCIFLANDYCNEKTKQLFTEYKKTHRI